MIGTGYTPSDFEYEEVYSGTNFKIWKKDGSGVQKCRTPVITISGGNATITCGTDGATIKYGFSSTEMISTYSAPVTMTDGQTIYAYATKDGLEDSGVASKEYLSEITYTITGSFPAWWGTAGDVMYAYIYGGADGTQWVPATYSSGTFTFTTGYDFTTCIAVRMKSGTTVPDWNNKWNQSNDIPKTGTSMTASSFE